MPLQEPDPATAGSAAPDLAPAPSRKQVSLFATAAILTVLVVAAVLISLPGKGPSEKGRSTVARTTAERRAAEVEARATVARPGTPVVAVGAAGSNGCTASWTVDGGGSPIVEFDVIRESAPAPPGPDGTEIGTALNVERTTDPTARVHLGWTVRVAATNALGTGPVSEPILCG